MSRRKIDDLYVRLNQKNRTTKRTSRTQQQPKMHLPQTNLSHNENQSIKIDSQTVESVISSTRKIRENEIQQWIDQEHPGPIEVLKRISEVSIPHHSVLTKIISELENIISNPLPPSEMYRHKKTDARKCDEATPANFHQSEPNPKPQVYDENSSNIEQFINYDSYADSYSFRNSRKMKSRLADLLIDLHDCQNAVSYKKERIVQLREELNEQIRQRDQFKSEFNSLQRLISTEKFGQYSAFKTSEEESQEFHNLRVDNRKTLKKQSEYSQLWGESRQLREDISKIRNQISENRKIQNAIIHEMAIKRLSQTQNDGNKEEESDTDESF